jgi:hypothetical protein
LLIKVVVALLTRLEKMLRDNGKTQMADAVATLIALLSGFAPAELESREASGLMLKILLAGLVMFQKYLAGLENEWAVIAGEILAKLIAMIEANIAGATADEQKTAALAALASLPLEATPGLGNLAELYEELA